MEQVKNYHFSMVLNLRWTPQLSPHSNGQLRTTSGLEDGVVLTNARPRLLVKKMSRGGRVLGKRVCFRRCCHPFDVHIEKMLIPQSMILREQALQSCHLMRMERCVCRWHSHREEKKTDHTAHATAADDKQSGKHGLVRPMSAQWTGLMMPRQKDKKVNPLKFALNDILRTHIKGKLTCDVFGEMSRSFAFQDAHLHDKPGASKCFGPFLSNFMCAISNSECPNFTMLVHFFAHHFFRRRCSFFLSHS